MFLGGANEFSSLLDTSRSLPSLRYKPRSSQVIVSLKSGQPRTTLVTSPGMNSKSSLTSQRSRGRGLMTPWLRKIPPIYNAQNTEADVDV